MSHPQTFEGLSDATNSRQLLNAFGSLAETISQLVCIIATDGRCNFVNTGWLKFTGLSRSEVIGFDLSRSIDPADFDMIRSREQKAAEAMGDFEVECKLRSETGAYHRFLMRAVPLLDGSWLCVFTNIEDIKLSHSNEILENQVEIQMQQLNETIQQLEAFSYSLAHDMRAPCRALTNYSQILLRDYQSHLPDEPRSYLHKIAAAAERLDLFIRDLLVYSRVAHDKMPLSPVNVEEVLADVVVSLPEFQPPLADLSVHLPLSAVIANETLLSQCLTNLLTNACKFVKKGEKPIVRIFEERRDDMVRIYVQDNGIGIPEAGREKIFNVFERLNHDKEFSGTGVGLSIVRKAVERMGGKVGFESKPENGSKFWLELKASPTFV